MSIISTLETKLNINVVKGLVKLGYYEKEGLSLALGTQSWNVVIVSPYSTTEESKSKSSVTKRLAINRDITAIETANFNENVDILLIGTTTNLLAYNVETNTDIFYKDVPDGVNSILFCSELSHFSNGIKQPIVIIGGNCSIQAFNKMGEEIFWTVTSDNVTCMILCDIDNDGINELLIGSEDCTIKAFKGEQIIYAVTESDVITHLQSLGNNCYSYGLKNGTIGVYIGNNKLWKIQNKEKITALNICHIDRNCVIIGWSNGLIEIRKIETGKIIWNKFCNSDCEESIAGIVCGNLRGNSNNEEIITISSNGFLTVLTWNKNKEKEKNSNYDYVNGLITERDELNNELRYLQSNYKILKLGNMNNPSLIASNTEITCTLTPSNEKKRLLLIMNTNNSTVIKCAIIYGDKIFKNGSFTLIPSIPKSSIILPLKFEKDLQCKLSIKAMVGHLSSLQNHIFELSHRIPKFASYLYVPTSTIQNENKPISYVTLVCFERINRLILWLNQAFLLEYEQNTKKTIDISFISLRNGKYITLQCKCDANNQNIVNIKIITDNLTLCGDIIQDIAQYLSITELQSTCYFNQHFKTLKENMIKVEQYKQIRNKLSIDIASTTSIIKNLIVKSQDSRFQKNYHLLKKQVSYLFDVNNEMCLEFIKRQNNHKNLINSLKLINKTIEQVSRLRVGKYQKVTVSLARQAVKNKNIDSLINVLHSVTINI